MGIHPAMGDSPPDSALAVAIDALMDGQIVGVPTDTVYGLAVNPFVPGATGKIFEAKRRPRGVVLPLLVTDVEQARELTTDLPAEASVLMERFWPGPLTLVLRRRPGLDLDLGEEGATVGVRSPQHPVPLALCAKVGPLATTSANLHGEATLETADAVARVFGERVPVVLDAGRCAGDPSTVVDCTGQEPRVLRQGRIPPSAIAAALESTRPDA